MIARVIQASLRHRRLVLAAALVFLAYGVSVVHQAKLDVYPSFAPAQTSVETEAPGLVAEQVEALVTRPIENALVGTPGVASIHSRSVQGLSIVTLVFRDGAKPLVVRQAIAERTAHGATGLPVGVGAPSLSPLTAIEGDLLTIGFTSSRLTPMALRSVIDWTVRPRLLAAPGVANARVYGGQVRRIEVRARAGDLSDSDLGYADVFNAVRRATGVAGGGFIDTPLQRILIEPHGQALTTDDVAAGQIQVAGSAPTRISDVADIVDAPAPLISDALIMGKPAVIVRIAAQYGTNTLEATRAVETAMAALKPALARQGIEVADDLNRPASLVSATVHNIVWQLAVAMALVGVLLVLVLRDPRAALVGVFGVALSLCAALVVLMALGWTLNSATLGGLAVGLGLVVDDAVLDIENLLSRLRDAEFHQASRFRAILTASMEVRAPVIYASALVVIGMLPIAVIDGPSGALLRPLAVSVIVTVLASLTVAMTVTPALARLFLNHVGPAQEPPIIHRIKVGYDALLARTMSAPRGFLLVVVGGLVLLAAVGFASFKTDVAPVFHVGHLTADIAGPPAASFSVMRDYGVRMTRDLAGLPGIAQISQLTGRAEIGEDSAGPERATLEIQLKPNLSDGAQDRVTGRIREAIAAYPGFSAEVSPGLQPLATGPAARGTVQVRIFGNDLAALDLAAHQVAAELAAIPGAGQIGVMPSDYVPSVRIDLNFQRLAIFGLSAADVLDTVQTAFEGRQAAQIYEDGRAIAIAVTAQVGLRQDPDGVGNLLLRSSSGVSVPLKTVANVYLTSGRGVIEHDNGVRRQIVTVTASGDTGAYIRRAKDRIDHAVGLPPGLYVEFVAPAEAAAARGPLLRNSALAACGMLAVLLLAFGRMHSSLLILGSTLFAFVGGVAAVALTGGVLSLGALVGFIALFGLSARNGTLLLSRIEDLVALRERPWSSEIARLAARQRLWAILTGALLVAAALLPFAMASGQPGNEILGPMALVIMGGLATSTVLSLLISPILALQFWRPRGTRPDEEDIVEGPPTA